MNAVVGTRRSVARSGDLATSRNMRLKDGRRVILRATRPGDEPAIQRFVSGLSIRTSRNRFFSLVRELSPEQLARLISSSSIDGFSLVAEAADGPGSRIVALAQYVVCEPLDAEFALVVDDAWQRRGLGLEMLGLIAEHSARAGLAAIVGFVLSENWPMRTLLARLDCEFSRDADPGIVRAVKRFDVHEGDPARAQTSASPPFASDFAAMRDDLDCFVS